MSTVVGLRTHAESFLTRWETINLSGKTLHHGASKSKLIDNWTEQITNSTEQSSCSEASSRSENLKFPCHSWNAKVHHRANNTNQYFEPNESKSIFFTLLLHSSSPLRPGVPSGLLSFRISVGISHLSHVLHEPPITFWLIWQFYSCLADTVNWFIICSSHGGAILARFLSDELPWFYPYCLFQKTLRAQS